MCVFPMIFQPGVALVVDLTHLAHVHGVRRSGAGGRVAWKYYSYNTKKYNMILTIFCSMKKCSDPGVV